MKSIVEISKIVCVNCDKTESAQSIFLIQKFKLFLCFIAFLLLNVLFFSSCKARKEMAATKKEEKKELNTLHIKKDLKKEIYGWIGTPYKFGGNDKKGVDCSGLVNAIFWEVYEKKTPRNSREIFAVCKPVKWRNLDEGNLIFFNFGGKEISHVGIYLNDGKFVHASSSKGVVISDLNNAYYKKYIVGYGKIK